MPPNLSLGCSLWLGRGLGDYAAGTLDFEDYLSFECVLTSFLLRFPTSLHRLTQLGRPQKRSCALPAVSCQVQRSQYFLLAKRSGISGIPASPRIAYILFLYRLSQVRSHGLGSG